MAEEYSREAVFEILGQEVPDKEMQRAESYADRKLERATEMQPEDTATYRSGWRTRSSTTASLIRSRTATERSTTFWRSTR